MRDTLFKKKTSDIFSLKVLCQKVLSTANFTSLGSFSFCCVTTPINSVNHLVCYGCGHAMEKLIQVG